MIPCRHPQCTNKPKDRGLCGRHIRQDNLRRRERGEWYGGQRVDAAPVIQHLTQLRAAGLGMRRLAELTGLTSQTIRVIRRQSTVFADTAAKILAIPVPQLPHRVGAPSLIVSGVGTNRRLQALITFGYTQTYLAQRMGMASNMFHRLFNQGNVTASTARRVEELFTELSLTPGPNTKARRRGLAKGWAPPFAWDEDTIDDPAAHPVGAVIRQMYRVPDDFADIVDDHRELGRTDEQIAESIGMTVKAFQRRLCRLGIPMRSAIAS